MSIEHLIEKKEVKTDDVEKEVVEVEAEKEETSEEKTEEDAPEEEKKPAAKKTAAKKVEATDTEVVEEPKKAGPIKQMLPVLIGALVLYGLGSVAPPSFMAHFTVFVLACFVGYMVIWNVSASLHTPLMSVTNAVSSIIIIGALIQISSSNTLLMSVAAFGVLITSINISGGFAVTQRMLEMFRK